MNVNELIQAFEVSIETDYPMLALSAPGIGKSDAAWQAACIKANKIGLTPVRALNCFTCITVSGEVRRINHETDYQFYDIRVSQLEPVDLRGIPIVIDGRTVFAVPEFWPTMGHGVILFDELTSATKSLQTPIYQITYNRQLGEYKLPDGFAIIAAGNRIKDRATAQQLSTALADRLWIVEIEPDPQVWVTWYDRQELSFMPRAFISFRKDLLHTLDKSQPGEIFATPRSWAKLGAIWDRIVDLPENIRAELVAGIVGKGAAAEFLGFIRSFAVIPSWSEIISSPDSAKVPVEPSALAAVCAMIARYVDQKTFSNAWQYLLRLPAEFRVYGIHLALEITSPANNNGGKDYAKSPLISAPGFSKAIPVLQNILTI